MTVERIEHIGIAVESIDEMMPYYRDVLSLEYRGEEVVEEQKVRVAFFGIGESSIELLEPTSEESPIAKFLAKRGSGIHHIAVRVDDIGEAIKQHEASGASLICSSQVYRWCISRAVSETGIAAITILLGFLP
jgi:methylmalonyl-CoA/ethylmalonyl-CoA epimerase